jgi:hypothetical protein
MLPVATSAPFALYLLLHSLHDRVQGHWPVPLFGALAICAAAAAPAGATPRARLARLVTPAIGFVIGALLVIDVIPALSPMFGPSDPTMALRGWPEFAAKVEQERRRTGAAWVGTIGYGTFAQLEYENTVTTPLLQVTERDRYSKDAELVPDFTRPGLIVDISRRLTPTDVGRCFAQVAPVAEFGRAGGTSKNQRYSAYLVSQPKRDVWIRGCPEEVRPGVWE